MEIFGFPRVCSQIEPSFELVSRESCLVSLTSEENNITVYGMQDAAAFEDGTRDWRVMCARTGYKSTKKAEKLDPARNEPGKFLVK
jgi:hypothetical protein